MLLKPKPASTLPEPLNEFEPIVREMGALGWSAPVVDDMELWQIGSFLGLDGRDAVAAGSRGILLPQDRKGGRLPGSSVQRQAPEMTPQIEARIAEQKERLRQLGRLPTGETPTQ